MAELFHQLGDFFTACWPSVLLTAVVAYLLGSVSFAILVTRWHSKSDIRDYGSGNAGATNVLRSQGKLPALLTTLGDLAKSALSVLVGRWIISSLNVDMGSQLSFTLVGAYVGGLFCILGHLYPVYFGFRGGKGVMTTLGMLLILNWRAALCSLAVFVAVLLLSRMVSLGSICAGIVMPVFTYLFCAAEPSYSFVDTIFCTLMTAFIAIILIIKHDANIRRILQGTEHRFSFGKKQKETIS